MAKSQSITVNLRIDGARETLAAFRRMPKAANDSLRDRSRALADALAGKVKSAAVAEGRQARVLASTVAARRDRLPVIQAGGTKRVGSRRKPAWKLLFGSVFGSNRLPQFKPHRGQDSYWFFSTVEDNAAEVSEAWNKVVDDIRRDFEGGA